MCASQSLPSVTEVWPSVIYLEYCGFLLYRTEPSVKKIKVVDCGLIAVPLILAVTPTRIFHTVTDLERSVVIPLLLSLRRLAARSRCCCFYSIT